MSEDEAQAQAQGPSAAMLLEYMVPNELESAFRRGYLRGVEDGLKAGQQSAGISRGFVHNLDYDGRDPSRM